MLASSVAARLRGRMSRLAAVAVALGICAAGLIASPSAATTKLASFIDEVSPVVAVQGYARFGVTTKIDVLVTAQNQAVSTTPTGTVTFRSTKAGVATPVVLGTVKLVKYSGNIALASLYASNLPLGDDAITTTYNGDSVFAGATSSRVPLVVYKDTETVSVVPQSPIAGQPATLTATTSVTPADAPAPSGSVTFREYESATKTSISLGSASTNSVGVATLATTALPAGVDQVYATFSEARGPYPPVRSPNLRFTVWPTPGLYVADYSHNSIAEFGTTAAGLPALGTIAGSNTGLSHPDGVVVDGRGRVYVANRGANTITEYNPGPTGNLAPVATIAGNATGLSDPSFLALDAAGGLYVSNGNNSVTVYAPGASGNVSPIAEIAGPNTGISDPYGIAVDPLSGALYVANNSSDAITAYPAGASGNATPVFTITGPDTGINGPRGLAFDSTGQLTVANSRSNTVTWYRPDYGYSGDLFPMRVFGGPADRLSAPETAVVDPVTATLVIDSYTTGAINSWPIGTPNNAVPSHTTTFPSAAAGPTQLAIPPGV